MFKSLTIIIVNGFFQLQDNCCMFLNRCIFVLKYFIVCSSFIVLLNIERLYHVVLRSFLYVVYVYERGLGLNNLLFEVTCFKQNVIILYSSYDKLYLHQTGC